MNKLCVICSSKKMKPTLGYFKLRGWAGPIRLLLAFLEVDYVEINYQLPGPHKMSQNVLKPSEREWKLEKDALGLSFPNLPYWIEDTVKLTETKAILRHIARTRCPKLLGQTLNEQAHVDMTEEFIWDLWNSLCQVCLTFEDKQRRKLLHTVHPKFALLSQNMTAERWTMGSNITLADFLLYEILYHYILFDATSLQPFPQLMAFMKKFENIPQISKYISSSQYIKGPCFSVNFKARL